MNDQNLIQEIEQLKQKVEALERSKTGRVREFMKRAFSKTSVLVGVAIAAVVTSFVIYAGTVSKPYTFTAGTTISASEVNDNFDTLYTLVNGNLDDDNISGIGASKITAGTVDSDRLPLKKIVVTTNAVTPLNALNEVTTEFGSGYRIATAWEALAYVSLVKNSIALDSWYWVIGGETQDMSSSTSRSLVWMGGNWEDYGARCLSSGHLAVYMYSTSGNQPLISCIGDTTPCQVMAIEK